MTVTRVCQHGARPAARSDVLARMAHALHKAATTMKRITRLTYSLFTAALLNLAACGGDGSSDPAEFSSATELQKRRAISAGSAMDAAFGFLYGSILSGVGPESQCPRVTQSGDTYTATTNCTDENGDVISGTIIAKNVPGFFTGVENDPSRPAIVTLEGFSIDDTSDENEDVAFDGTVTLNPDGSLVADLTATLEGVTIHSSATWRAAGEMSTADDGSSIDVDGLGSAEIKGSWSVDSEAPAGSLELHGADVLAADFGRQADGCVPIRIDGQAAGQLCDTDDGQ